MSEACEESVDAWDIDVAPPAFIEALPGTAGAPTVVVARGEFDAADDQFEGVLRGAVRTGTGQVVLDLTEVSFIDSSVVRALVLAQREAADRDGWLRVVWTHPVIGRVLEVCGLDALFPQYATVADAN